MSHGRWCESGMRILRRKACEQARGQDHGGASWSGRAQQRPFFSGWLGSGFGPRSVFGVRPGLRSGRNPGQPTARSVRSGAARPGPVCEPQARVVAPNRGSNRLRNEPKSLWKRSRRSCGRRRRALTAVCETNPNRFGAITRIGWPGRAAGGAPPAVTVLIDRIRGWRDLLGSPLPDMSSIGRFAWRKSLFCREVVSHYRTKPTGAGADLQSSVLHSG